MGRLVEAPGQPSRSAWSRGDQLYRLRGAFRLYNRTDDVDVVLAESGIILAEIPRQALFLAGKAFQAYRRRGGTRTGVLPDFFIGAHADAVGIPLLTRDARHYRTYFPDVTLITPHQ